MNQPKHERTNLQLIAEGMPTLNLLYMIFFLADKISTQYSKNDDSKYLSNILKLKPQYQSYFDDISKEIQSSMIIMPATITTIQILISVATNPQRSQKLAEDLNTRNNNSNLLEKLRQANS